MIFINLDETGKSGYLYIETKLDRFINEGVKKLPLNISIVIDRSGSMGGEKMEYARSAAMSIIDRLQPQDQVSVVVYDDEVEVIQPSVHVVDKAAIKNRISRIEIRGSTNLWGGSEAGFKQVLF
jgi:Ca-activated chloride channel family protein